MAVLRCAVFVLSGALSIALQAAESISLNGAQVRSLGVEVAVAEAGKAAGQSGLPGRVTVPNDQMRVVAAPVAGMVEMLAVGPGSVVKRGQIVARLASPQALELQSGALQAGSQAQLARQTLRRDEQLFAEGLIAESRLQASRAAAAQAIASAEGRRQGLALAGVVPGKVGGSLALVSPIDGVVLEQDAQVGQRVDASTLIYRIARLAPLWLEIQAPANLAGNLRIGAPVRVASTAARGRVIAVGGAVDAGSQSVLVRAAVEAGGEGLRPGQAIEVELDVPAAAGLRLPSAALARHAGQTVVFVQTSAKDGMAFRPQAVKVLGQGGDSVLLEGLRTGEPIAVKGVSGLKALWTGVGRE